MFVLMVLERLKSVLSARDPLGRLDDSDVRRLVVFSSLAMGGIGAVLVLGIVLILDFYDHTVIATGLGCAAILSIPLVMRAGLPVRGGAWIFVAIVLAACFYVALDPLNGVTAGLMVFLVVLMLFTGAALGARALLAVGLVSIAGVIGLTVLDISRLPVTIGHQEPSTVIIAGVRQIGAILITITLVYGAIGVYRRAMVEVRAARDEARRASAAKSAFLANTSHEIRTPLNGVLGMAQVLGATDLTPDQRRYLDTISDSGRTLLAMLNDVLDLSKVEAGQLDVTRAATDIRELLSSTIAAWRPEAEKKGLILTLEIAADLPDALQVDRIRVRQCVENLLSNSVKFTDSGSIQIRVYGVGRNGGHVLSVVVEDTGIGIPDDALRTIFEPFRQVDDTLNRRHGGTGLGLAIVRNLAELMGGSLAVTSRVGRGSTFTLTLAAPDMSATAPSGSITHQGSLLLIDPNPASRKVARMILEGTGRTIAEAEDLADALVQSADENFDAVVVDLEAPGLDNSLLRGRLRANGASGPRPLVLISEHVDDAARRKALGLDDCAFVPKPLERERLITAVDGIG